MPSVSRLPADVRAELAAGRGLLRAADFEGPGRSRSRLHRLERKGDLVVVAKGVYADAAALAAADPWSAFRLRTRAFLLAGAPNTYAAGWSSAVLHGLPTTGRPPQVPTVIRPGSRVSGSNRTCHGRTRFAAVPDRWLGQADGCPAVGAAFAAVDLARHAGAMTGLVLADAVAFRPGGREQLGAALADIGAWTGSGRVAWSVRHCDPDVESPLESVGRCAFLRAGLPLSLSNVWVGEFVPEVRLDHYWPQHRVGAEGDGVGKYLLADPAAAIRKEKEREWLLQRMGIRLVRYTWPVATRSPDLLAAQVQARLAEPARSGGRIRTWARDDGLAQLGLPAGRPRPDLPRTG